MTYDFLKAMQPPIIVLEGLKLMGTAEVPGAKSNAEIMSWAREVGVANIYTNDDIAWCGLFVALLVKRTGREIVKEPLWARSWLKWGVKSELPSLGDIMVFSRDGGGGHVAVYIAEDATTYHVLGGNQGNKVSITRIKKDRLLDARSPIYKNRPESVRPYFVSANGAISNNEA